MDQSVRILGTRIYLITFLFNNKYYYYTTHATKVVSNGRTFIPTYNEASNIRASQLDVRADVDIDVKFDSEIANIVNQSSTSKRIKVFINEAYSEYPDEIDERMVGYVIDNLTNGNTTKITVRSIHQTLKKQANIMTYQDTCNHSVGKGFCTVNMDLLKFTATVINILENGITLTLSRTIPAAFTEVEKNKYIVFGTCKNSTDSVTILEATNSLTNSNIRVKSRLTGLKIGDIVTLTPGCDGLVPTCKVKFNNFKDYIGFPDVPGEDGNPFNKI